MIRSPLTPILLLVLVFAAAFGRPASAQSPGAGAGSAAGPGAVGGVGEVDVGVELLGIGGKARPGEWTGLRVQLKDFGPAGELREVLMRLALDDPDRDRVIYERSVASRGQDDPRPVWIYFRAPFNTDWASSVRVEADEGQERGDEIVAGRFLGEGFANFQRAMIGANQTMIATVGRDDAGVGEYAMIDTSSAGMGPLTAHEVPDVVGGLRTGDLPDRWMGLAALDVLVWTGSGLDDGPGSLTPDQADAIEEWVRRGGHLVVVLPVTAQSWLRPGSALADLLPRVSATRVEGVSLEPFRWMLTTSSRSRLGRSTIHVFEPETGADAWDAVRLLAGPEGRCVAARRGVGAGMVTLVGLPLASRELRGVVQADVFWNRVLGKRAEIMTANERVALVRANQFQMVNRGATVYLDEEIEGQIAKNGQAAAGLVLAVVVFAAFWTLAAPVSFFVLSARGKRQHAWVAFVLIVAAFTGIAWGGATAIRPRDVDGRHLTYLDQVYGQSTERARSWFTVFLPGYGTSLVELEPQGVQGGAPRRGSVHQALAPWESAAGGSVFAGFPDKRSYTVDSGDPSSMRVPTRSTVKQFRADVLRPMTWKGPAPTIEASTRVGEELRVMPVETPTGAKRWQVNGKLSHNLPGALTDVRLVFVGGQNEFRGAPITGQLPFDAKIVSLTGAWEPGDQIDLWQITGREDFQRLTGGDNAERLLESLARPRGFADGRYAWSLYDVLKTPNPRERDSRQLSVVERREGHELDLSMWMSQPCVIVLGQLDDAPAPFRLLVNGSEAPLLGRTIVRWVYPLGSNPPGVRVPRSTDDPNDDDGDVSNEPETGS